MMYCRVRVSTDWGWGFLNWGFYRSEILHIEIFQIGGFTYWDFYMFSSFFCENPLLGALHLHFLCD